jgi:hypothetical protein
MTGGKEMASNDHRPLSEHSMTTLTKIEILVEELLGNKSALPWLRDGHALR